MERRRAGMRPGALRRFLRHRMAMAGLLILCSILALCFLAPPLLPESFKEEMALEAMQQPPSREHPMGTDDLGRDVLYRVLMGGRISLMVGILGALSAALIGSLVGGVAGLHGGRVDMVLMRITDAFLALPILPLMIILSAFMTRWNPFAGTPLMRLVDPSVVNLLVIVVTFGWMTTARLVRASFIALKGREFILAARALGASETRVAFVHLYPNSVAPVLVSVTITVGRLILTESALSFLGLGVQLPTPTWGNMLKGAEETLETTPWLAIFPGLFILFSVLSVNFLGDGIRDALDPRK